MLTDRELLLAPGPAYVQPRFDSLNRKLHRLAFWCIILNVAVAALVAGLILRRYAWDQTEPIRYTSDLDNAFFQGTQTLEEGYLDRYLKQVPTSDGDYDFDYAPGRLAVATLWTRWVRHSPYWRYGDDSPRFYESLGDAKEKYALVRPLLVVNTVGEILSAIAMFLLVRQWTSGSSTPGIFRWPQDRPARSAILGLVAALFFWFNPALIWNAHCWPQWDSWVLPFTLWGLVFASADFWFCAGVAIAAGMMFKAQILFGAPLFVLWPLWRGQLLAIVRWIIGAAIGTTLITAGWLLRTDEHLNTHALNWVICAAIAVPLIWLAIKMHWHWGARTGVAVVAILLAVWPLFHFGVIWMGGGLLALLALAAVIQYAPRRALAYAIAAWIATTLFACVPIFNGSMAWFHIGITYGTHRYMMMTRGSDNNLAGILESQWRWDLMDPAVTIPAGHIANRLGSILSAADIHFSFVADKPLDIPLKYLLFAVYFVAMILCSLGAAMHSKRGSPRFLIAVAAPWIVFFAVLTQMHQRYLLWGATISAATVALGPGWALLHLVVTMIAWSQEAVDMMKRGATDNTAYTIISGWTPGIGWALLLIAAIFVYNAVLPDRRRVIRRVVSIPVREPAPVPLTPDN